VFIVIGAALSLDPVIGFSDSMIFSMSIANVIGLYILAKTVRNEVRRHLGKFKIGSSYLRCGLVSPPPTRSMRRR